MRAGSTISAQLCTAPKHQKTSRSIEIAITAHQFSFAGTQISLAGRLCWAHMVHLDLDVDLAILSEGGTTVAHNPTSNCKLASGTARVPEMLAGRVNVSLGTDGAPCSNTYDMFREMHLAGILHKGANHDAS